MAIISEAFEASQVSVSSSAVEVAAPSANNESVVVKNLGPETVYIGNSGVTTGQGYPLSPGESVDGGAVYNEGSIYAITAGGTSTLAAIML